MGRAVIGRAIDHVGDPGLPSAVGAAVALTAGLVALADDRHLAVSAAWSERLDRTLERIEHVSGASHLHFERLVVGISTALAGLRHERQRLQGARRLLHNRP